VPPLSPRLTEILDALPLEPGMRVLEIGGAPGALGRRIAERIGPEGFVLEIDRSGTGAARIEDLAVDEIAAGRMAVRCVAVEEFQLLDGEAPFDLAIAVRVGALDGRHPDAGAQAIPRLRAALVPGGRVYIDGGTPLRELPLD